MAIKVGIAPDSWGIWFPNHEKQTPWQRCMDEMAQAGYEGVELGPWGYFPNTNPALKQALDARSLTLVAATVGADFLDDDSVDGMCATIADMSALMADFAQAKYIVLLPGMYTDLQTGEVVMNPQLTDEQWKKYAANVQRAADAVSIHGLVPAFHPHVDCHVQTEAEIERLLEDTDVGLCFDLGHHVYGGGEPISFYRKHSDRIPYIHIKDCDMKVKARMDAEKWSFARAVTEDIMVEPGRGSIDFKQMYAALTEKGYDGWVVVEQDLFPVKSFDIPYPIAKRTRESLREAGFK
ncbi:MAG: sugar phosphate isomerase/epimerase [Clostridia bacterium]|nr:sugar phosphate isomerase/epimerase [Clostridia bacterium]